MTLAAGVEIAIGVSLAPPPGRVPGSPAGATDSALRTGSSASVPAPDVESFRSGWEALLASLGAGMTSPNEAEAKTSQVTTALEGLAAGSGGKTADSFLAGRATPPLTEVGTPQSAVAQSTSQLPTKGPRTGLAATQTAPKTQPQVAISTVKNLPKPDLPESGNGTRRIKLDKNSISSGNTLNFEAPPSVSAGPSAGFVVDAFNPNPSGAAGSTVLTGQTGAPQDQPRGWMAKPAGGDETSAGRSPLTKDSPAGANSHHEPLAASAVEPGQTADAILAGGGGSDEMKPALAGEAPVHAMQVLAPPDDSIQAVDQTPSRNLPTQVAAAPAGGFALGQGAAATDPEPYRSGQAKTTTMERKSASGLGGRDSAVSSVLSAPRGESHAAVQPGSLEQTGFAPTGDPASLRGGLDAARNPATESNAALDRPGPQATFAALDAEPPQVTWIHAGARHAEAGFQDPALGWVGVRAEVSGGVIHAALVPGSVDAAQALGSHIAGLNAFLAEHHAPVETMTLSLPESRGGDFGMDRGTGQSMHQGAGQGAGQGQGQETNAGQQANAEARLQAPSSAVSSQVWTPAAGTEATFQSVASRPGANHISVMA